MIKYISELITLLFNAGKNPKALAAYLVALLFLGLNWALGSWLNFEIPADIQAALTEWILPFAMTLAIAIGGFFTRLTNTGQDKWKKTITGGNEAFVKEEK